MKYHIFSKIWILIIAFAVVAGGFVVLMQSSILSKITPDSNFYFLKTWSEQIQLFFTFNPEDKIERQLHFSDIRLTEYKTMIERGNDRLAQKVLEKYEKQMNKVIGIVAKLEQENRNTEDISRKLQNAITNQIEFLESNLPQLPESGKEIVERVSESSLKYFTVPSDWKSYRNEVFGFEIKYPSEWEIWQVKYGDTKKYTPSIDAKRLEIGPKSIKEATWGVKTYGILSLFVKQDKSYQEMVSQMDSYLGREWLISKEIIRVGDKVTGVKYITRINTTTTALQVYAPLLKKYVLIISSNAGLIPKEFFPLLKEKIIVSLVVKSLRIFEPQEVSLWNTSCSLPELSILEIKVKPGEGLTHIARKAVNTYVTGVNLEKFPKKTIQLLPEEKVYAEDFIVKQLGAKKMLYPGDVVKIPCSIVENTLRKARQLTIQQRKNLESFGKSVTEFEIIKKIQDIINKSGKERDLKPFIISP